MEKEYKVIEMHMYIYIYIYKCNDIYVSICMHRYSRM